MILGYKTVVEAMRGCCQEYPTRRALGTRELISEEDEKQPNGRVFKKSTYGEYKWLTFEQINNEIDQLAVGLQKLGVTKGDKVLRSENSRK